MPPEEDLRDLLEMHGANLNVLRSTVLAPYEADPRVVFTQARLKGFDRALRKLNDDVGVGNVHDLTGLRIVTLFNDHPREIANEIQERFDGVEKHTKRPKSPSEFGYRGVHLRITLTPNEALKFGVDVGNRVCKFEVQIRSMMAHTWSEVEHAYQYRVDSELPDHLQREFATLSALLELADQSLESLRDQAEKLQEEVSQALTREESVRIHTESVSAAIRQGGAATKHDARMANMRGSKTTGVERARVSRAASMLTHLGKKDLNQLLRELANDTDYDRWLRQYNERRRVKGRPVSSGETLLLYPEYLALQEDAGIHGKKALREALMAAGMSESNAEKLEERLWSEVQQQFEAEDSDTA